MDNRYFQRGSGRFSCALCGRQTRETKESGCDMCADCFHLCSWDNHHNDNAEAPTAKELSGYDKHLANIAKKGGNAQKVKSFCSFIWSKV